jgi:putative addiction module CopG family antidote
MNVHLDAELEDLVRQKVDDGLYPDVDTIMQEALRLLDRRDRLAYLRAAIARADAQIERGEYVEWTPDLLNELSREAEEMVRQGIQPHPDVRP